jgi:RHS repeat-associated protein
VRRAGRSVPVKSLIAGIAVLGLGAACASGSSAWCGELYTPPSTPPMDPARPCFEKCNNCTGSPCYLGTGVYGASATDLRVKAVAGFPLEVSRRYLSSQIADGPMGYGWMPSVVSRLTYSTYQYAGGTYQKRAYVLMPGGMRLLFIENPDGTFTAPPGRHDVLVKTGTSFRLTIQHTRSSMFFSPTGYLTQMRDDYGNILSFTYQTGGTRIRQLTDFAGSGYFGSGRYITIGWGPDGRISSVADSTGRFVQYSYDANGALTSVIDPLNRTTRYAYDERRFAPLLTEIRDNWDRIVTTVQYETRTDRVHSYTEAGELYTMEYHPELTPPQVRKTAASFPPNSWHTYSYETAFGQITAFNDTAGSWGTTYYPDGSVMQVKDPLGIKTFYTYNSLGNITQLIRNYLPSAGVPVRFDYTYDDGSFPEQVSTVKAKKPDGSFDPDWIWWQYVYYPLTGSAAPGALWQVRRNGVIPALATYEYDSQGRVTKYTDAVGGSTSYTYDGAGNTQTVTLPANNNAGTRQISYGYDALGRVTAVTDPAGRVTSYEYDALDRVTSVTLSPVSATPGTFTTSYSYDNYDAGAATLYTRVTDPNGIVTQQGFNQYDQVVDRIDGLGHHTAYSYERGHLKSLTDAHDYTTAYTYDAANRLKVVTFPDGSSEMNTYGADGLLKTTSRGGVLVSYSYDPLKRIWYEYSSYSVGAYSFQRTYTGQKLTRVDEYHGTLYETTNIGYDSAFRVNSVSNPRGSIRYVWQNNDLLHSYAVDGSTPTASYAYYPDGSVKTITWVLTGGTFTFLYDTVGRRTKLTFPQAQHRDYAYDEQGRLTSIATRTGANVNLATYQYGYDRNWSTGATLTYDRKGLRTSLTATVPSLSTLDGMHQYQYDPAYQLTSDRYPNGASSSWSYDAIGNVTRYGSGAATYQKIGSNPNNWQRLLNDGRGRTFSYDGRGNVASLAGPPGENFGYTWDARNHLTAVSNSVTASYTYDFKGLRSSKAVAGARTSYVYNGLDPVREKSGSGLITTADYLFGPDVDEPLAMKRGGIVYYYVVDGLGSVRLVIDSANGVKTKYQWDAWGKRESVTADAIASPFGYTAREIGDAKDHYYRARYYYPAIGRFLSEDPDWGAQLESLALRPSGYAAMLNDPIENTDPLGLDVRTCCRPVRAGDVPIVGRYASSKNHCYVETTSGPRGRRTYGLHNLNGIAMFQRDEPTDVGGTCTPWRPDPDCKLDRCLQAAASNYPVLPYSTVSAITGIGSGANSNTFANGITTACGIYVNPYAHAHSPGWYQPIPSRP